MKTVLIAAVVVPLLALGCSPIPRPGSWRIAGAVPSSLTYVIHMVRLTDGRVLLLSFDDAIAIFDPETNRWTQGMRVPIQTTGETLTQLADGSLLLAGGDNVSGPLGVRTSRAAYVYLPAEDRWERVGDMLQGRASFSATRLVDGRVLVAGGEADGRSLATCELYDPRTRSWSEAPSLPVRRVYQSSALLSNGTVLLAGGDVDVGSNNFGPIASGRSPGSYPYTNEEVFDPRRDRWSTLTPPQPVEDPTVMPLPDGEVLFTGGHFGQQPSPFTFLYSPTLGSWTREADSKGGGDPVVMSDGRLLFLFPPYTYDLSQDLWMPATSPPGGDFLLGPAVELDDGFVLALASPGRFGQGGLLLATYDPSGFPPLPGSAGALANPSLATGLAIAALVLLLLTGLRYVMRATRMRP